MSRLLFRLIGAYLSSFAVISRLPEAAGLEFRLLTGSLEYSFDAYRQDGKASSRSALLALWDHVAELQPLALFRTATSEAEVAGIAERAALVRSVQVLPLFVVYSLLTGAAVVFASLAIIWPDAKNRTAMRAAFLQQWRDQLTIQGTLAPLLASVALAVGLAWVLEGNENSVAVSHVIIGAPLMGLWQMGVFRTGWTFEDERLQGTLDLLIASQTPLIVVMLGKTLAIMVSQAATAALVLLIFVVLAGPVVPVVNVPLLLGSALLAICSVVTICLLFSPLVFLVRARGGSLNAIIATGTILSGFILPTAFLPPALEGAARVLPTAWAMDGVMTALSGGRTVDVLTAWLVAVGLICALMALAALLFRKAEERVRVTMNLGTF